MSGRGGYSFRPDSEGVGLSQGAYRTPLHVSHSIPTIDLSKLKDTIHEISLEEKLLLTTWARE